MKWIHVLQGSDRFNVRADFIENYELITELNIGEKYWVFWSPDDSSTPRSHLRKEKKIIRVTSEILKKNKGKPIAGFYEATLLMVKDSEKELEAELAKKRITIPTSSSSGVASTKSAAEPAPPKRGSVREKRMRKAAGKKNMESAFETEDGSDQSTIDDPEKIAELKRTAAMMNVVANPLKEPDDGSAIESSDEEDDSGDLSGSSDVPVAAYRDVAKELKEKKSRLREMKKKMEEKSKEMEIKFEAEMKRKLKEREEQFEKEMRAKLKEKDEALRKLRESETRLVGECLRRTLTGHEVGSSTALRKSPTESTPMKQTDGKSSASAPDEIAALDEESDNFMSEWQNDMGSDSHQPSPSTPEKATARQKEEMSDALKAKRKELFESLEKGRRRKKRSSSPVTSYEKETWEKSSWRLTPAQESTLLKATKKGSHNDSKFVKKVAGLLWEREEMAMRSSRGKAGVCQTETRPECTPAKKFYMLYLLNNRVTNETTKDEEIKARANLDKIQEYLTSKIATVRRDLRNELEKKDDDE